MYKKFNEKTMQDVMAIARKALDSRCVPEKEQKTLGDMFIAHQALEANDLSLLTKEQAQYLLGCRRRNYVAEDGTIQNSEYAFTLREWYDIERYCY